MVLGWRRAFCTTIPKDQQRDSPIVNEKPDPNPSPRLRTRLGGFFSNPSTPRVDRSSPVDHSSAPQSPKLRCKTGGNGGGNDSDRSPRLLFRRSSAPSSPRSPSAFSLLKSSIGLSKSRCGVCLQSAKAGQGVAIFTAECGHVFHFPCVVANAKEGCAALACPVCRSTWKETDLLNFNGCNNRRQSGGLGEEPPHAAPASKRSAALKVYDDDEPLNSSPACGARFSAIPESEEEEEEDDEFPGFFVDNLKKRDDLMVEEVDECSNGDVEFEVLPEAAVVAVGKTSETHAVVLKIKAPSASSSSRRAPVDLVVVANVSSSVITAEKLYAMKKAMRTVISSLSSSDRLSIVAFSSATSKRLLPLRRMTSSGKRSAKRIVDAVASIDGPAASAADSLKKAAKVIEDRRERNLTAAVILFSDGGGKGGDPLVSSTRFSNLELPVHTVNLSACVHAPDLFPERVTGLLTQVVHDLRVQLCLATGSGPGEISAVYSYSGRPVFVGSGSGWFLVGDMISEEEWELLVELKIPNSDGGAQRTISVRCRHKDPLNRRKEVFRSNDRRPLVVPPARNNRRLRCLFVETRAVAESRRLGERSDAAGAHRMLASARAVVRSSGEEFVRGLDAELAQLNCKRRNIALGNVNDNDAREAAKAGGAFAEPLTPTSAWRAAERLAKVAIMRKSLNRVSDLHGFENARF